MGGIPGNVLPALRKGEGGKGNAGLAAVSLASRAALAAMFSLRGKGLGRPGGSPAILLCSIIACLEGEKESTCKHQFYSQLRSLLASRQADKTHKLHFSLEII